MKKMMPDQTLIIITVAVTASQVIAVLTVSLPPAVDSPRSGKAETSCAILASAMPPIRLARTIPCETAFSERRSIAAVPAFPADRRVVTSYWEIEGTGGLDHPSAWMSAPSWRVRLRGRTRGVNGVDETRPRFPARRHPAMGWSV